MRKREIAARAARTQRLGDAVVQASMRLKNVRTPLVVKIGTPTFEFIEYGTGLGVMPAISIEQCSSWRVGRNPGDKFFELKLVPARYKLALPMPRAEGQTQAEDFILVPMSELVVAYTPAEIKEIIKLLAAIEVFDPPLGESSIRFLDIATPYIDSPST